jgi:hypothetical protein
MRTCPSCAERIQDAARICPHCRTRIGFRPDRLFWVLLAVCAVAYCSTRHTSQTTNMILDAKRACEAQTGQPC